jgi:hypothetical protein
MLPLPPHHRQAAADAASRHQRRQLQLPHRCSHRRRRHTAANAIVALPTPTSCVVAATALPPSYCSQAAGWDRTIAKKGVRVF